MIIYSIPGPWAGQLAIVPRPRGGDWLEDELHALKSEGFDVVVSLLTGEESEELGLICEAGVSQSLGLDFLNLPIPDLNVPEPRNAAHALLSKLYDKLIAGKHVAIHCRQGIGRSGLVAASLLVLAGIDPMTAFRKTSSARGLPVPETDAQRDWVMDFSREVLEPVTKG